MLVPAVTLLLTLAAPSTPPAPPPGRSNLAGLVSQDDYPREALRKGEQGTVTVTLAIDETGHVSGCKVTESSGSESLDSTTCRVLSERARFKPARDAGGRPVTDTYTQKIGWRIQTAAQVPPEFRAAATAWLSCLSGSVGARLAGTQSPETITAEAFDACVAAERALAAAGAKLVAHPAAAGSEEMRAGVRAQLLTHIARARAGSGGSSQ